MTRNLIMIMALVFAVPFIVFVALAQLQILYVHYFTPTYILFDGLREAYAMNDTMTFDVSLKGYGSNCIVFELEMLRQVSLDAVERIAYFSKIDDCRKIQISHGPFNYSQPFSYSGSILTEPGDYIAIVKVFDQATRLNITASEPFTVLR